MYFCTLVDLPNIIEAMKTLDRVTYYKSCDVAQMLYVHNHSVDVSEMTQKEISELTFDFKKEDPAFFASLFRRQAHNKGTIKDADKFKFRHGLSPATKNVRNIRFKKE